MRRTIIAMMLFGGVFALMFCIFRRMEASTAILENGASLPLDIYSMQYTLRNHEYVPEEDRYTLLFPLEATLEAPLALTMTDISYHTLYINEEQASVYRPTSVYMRTQVIVIPAEWVNAAGRLKLSFDAASWGSADKELISGANSSVPKLLLGSAAAADSAVTASFAVTIFSMGIYFLLMLSSITLYITKRSETYLLLLSAVCGMILVTTVITSSKPILQISSEFYMAIRPIIMLLPVLLNAALCIILLKNCLPFRLQGFVTSWRTAAVIVVIMLLQSVLRRSLYHVLYALLFIPQLVQILAAIRKKEPGGYLLLTGYSVIYALVIRIYSVNAGSIALPSQYEMYIRITQLGHLFYLILCMVLINVRFAHKFVESEHLNKRLDTIVAERTSQLTAEQQRRRRLLQNVFHDLRSPVFVLKGYLALTESPIGADATLQTEMKRRVLYLERLIEDLYLISRLEEEQISWEGDYVNLSSLVEGLALSGAILARQQSKQLNLSAKGNIVIWGDEQRLQQAIQNLIDNALTYTGEEGSISLQLDCIDGFALLEVSDTGKGIKEEDIPLVFERYYSNRNKSAKSTGLGLTIARTIIEQHHGHISVASKLEKGTTFAIYLPLLEP